MFETEEISEEAMKRFSRWYDKNIGADLEINQIAHDLYYAVCLDIEEDEAYMVADYLRNNIAQ
jgi:hypothetical protein